MNDKIKGFVCGIIAAMSYGTNPLGALNLYADHIGINSVLFYRYGLALLLLLPMLLIKRESLRLARREIWQLLFLGICFSISSLTLFSSFNYMDAGVASTMLFVYPVMVAVIMAVFFHEKLTAATLGAIGLSLAGVVLLYHGDGNTHISTTGVILVMLSSLSYAIYMIAINRFNMSMSSFKLTFYVLIVCMVIVVLYAFTKPELHLQWLTTPRQWLNAAFLAIFPTFIALVLIAVALRCIGSTPTAILGALEPLTAVAIGVLVFHEAFTLRCCIGIILILSAVALVVLTRNKSQVPPKKVQSQALGTCNRCHS